MYTAPHKCSFIFFIVQRMINEKFFVAEHHCPGDLQFKDEGPAFPPTCSNPQLQTEFLTSTCLPQNGGYFCALIVAHVLSDLGYDTTILGGKVCGVNLSQIESKDCTILQ